MSQLIASLERHERPRERLAILGPGALRDAELVALVLRNGRPGAGALSLAEELLVTFGGLSGLRSARPEELSTVPGVGPAKAAGLVAACQLGARTESTRSDAPILRRPADVAAAVQHLLADARRERVVVLVVDASLRLRHTVVVTEGGLDRSLVPVREVLNAVLRHDGRGFALAHNHPSGDPTPSDADRRTTAAVADGARTVGLRFLGHVVVAGGQWSEVVPTPARRTPG